MSGLKEFEREAIRLLGQATSHRVMLNALVDSVLVEDYE